MRAEFENLQMSVHQKAVHPEIDYLSAQNDARIIPFLTSPQRMKKVSGLMRFFTKEVAYKKQQMVAGPVKDQKKMWCAPSTRGKAQITIRMAARMSPERLAITQNMAYSEALNLDSYPKEFELWAHVADDKAREAILAEVLQIYPDILTKTESQYDRHLAPEHTLPDSFVPLGRYSYDVRFNQAHQNWAVKTAISQYNVSTIAVAIRINSNWGNLESTCLHQVSLYGEHMDERKVYDDPTVGDVWPLW